MKSAFSVSSISLALSLLAGCADAVTFKKTTFSRYSDGRSNTYALLDELVPLVWTGWQRS